MRKNRISLFILYCAVPIALIFVTIFVNRTATTISEGKLKDSGKCIIIDPGHGGEDGGATSCTGKLESAFNLEIGMRLNDVMQLLGMNTKMIRTADKSIYTSGNTIAQKKISDLKERVAIVNSTENGMIISIHQNYFSDSRYSGAQVFYPNTESSYDLAQTIQKDICQYLQKSNRRKTKKASGIYLMEHIQHTGVLIECGFLSNPQEEAQLRSESYQKALCCIIATSVRNFLDRNTLN